MAFPLSAVDAGEIRARVQADMSFSGPFGNSVYNSLNDAQKTDLNIALYIIAVFIDGYLDSGNPFRGLEILRDDVFDATYRVGNDGPGGSTNIATEDLTLVYDASRAELLTWIAGPDNVNFVCASREEWVPGGCPDIPSGQGGLIFGYVDDLPTRGSIEIFDPENVSPE